MNVCYMTILMIAIMKLMIKSMVPIPHNIPVRNLRKLFDIIENINCIPPSIIISIHKIIHNHIGNIILSANNVSDTTYPTIIPVQRLHIRN